MPTAKELGHDLVYFMQRSINGPPGMSEEAQQWYIELFSKVFASEQWQSFCKSEGLFCDESVDEKEAGVLGDFHKAQYERHKKLIDQVGAAAITGE